jgi:nucleotide-binding universal stress UspA family protein
VPVNGTPISLDALSLACSLSKRSKGTVYAVYVIEVARTLALDAEMVPEAREAEEVLQDAERIAAESDGKVEGEILQRATPATHRRRSTEREVSAIAAAARTKCRSGSSNRPPLNM